MRAKASSNLVREMVSISAWVSAGVTPGRKRPKQLEVADGAVVFPFPGGKRKPQIHRNKWHQASKPGRSDPDHGIAAAGKRNLFAHELRVCAEKALPHRVADHDNPLVILGRRGELLGQLRIGAKQREVVGRNNLIQQGFLTRHWCAAQNCASSRQGLLQAIFPRWPGPGSPGMTRAYRCPGA